ncbi:hypothetical protein SSS_00401 [Sarcoptes scabiei]|nr:hypothetical protein SSS_00401 [Sarcoptes scabiei]
MDSSGMIRFSIILACLIMEVMASNKTVCYDGYGCFNAQVFPGLVSRLPVAPESLKVTFHFFTCGSHYKSKIFNQFVTIKKLKQNARFNPKLKTIFVIHGYKDHFNETEWTGQLKNLLLSSCECSYNIIGVDYPSTKYLNDFANVQILGAIVAKLIQKLSRAFEVETKRFICVGHSLGAQICGFTGKHLKSIDKLEMIWDWIQLDQVSRTLIEDLDSISLMLILC